MKCRFFLFFASLLFLAFTPEMLHSTNPPTPSGSITLSRDNIYTAADVATYGTTALDARIANAANVANRALAGEDVKKAADAYTTDQTTITSLTTDNDNLQSDKNLLDTNQSGLIGGMVGLAAVGAGAAGIYKWRNNNASRKNVQRKAKHARELALKMADDYAKNQDDPRKATKLRDALAAIMTEEHKTVERTLDKTKGLKVERKAQLLHGISAAHTASSNEKDRLLYDAHETLLPQLVDAPETDRVLVAHPSPGAAQAAEVAVPAAHMPPPAPTMHSVATQATFRPSGPRPLYPPGYPHRVPAPRVPPRTLPHSARH